MFQIKSFSDSINCDDDPETKIKDRLIEIKELIEERENLGKPQIISKRDFIRKALTLRDQLLIQSIQKKCNTYIYLYKSSKKFFYSYHFYLFLIISNISQYYC